MAIQAGRRYKRLNIIAGLCQNKVIAPYYYDWNTTSQWFEVWFEWHLCPHLPPNSVIVMDNARFHRKSEVNRMAKLYGHLVWWLPPYSPDKNPIEKLWANMKHWLHRNAHLFDPIQSAISSFFKSQ